MRVTIIYDSICLDGVNCVNVQTIILGDEVRYYVQNTEDVNYRYRGFLSLYDVYDFARCHDERLNNATEFEFVHKMAFKSESEMCSWINSICNTTELTEVFA